MKIALLTNSKLSIPSISVLAENNLLCAVGIPSGKGVAEELDHITYTALQYKVPVESFTSQGLGKALEQWLDACQPDVVFVYTFPFKIPSRFLDKPAYGFINFHFGLLPEYRGADAIFWQIRNREKYGAISVHKMIDRFDAGPLYLVHKIPLMPVDTYGSHVLALSIEAIQAAQKIIHNLHTGNMQGAMQDETRAGYFHRPQLADVVIDWSKPAADIIALINATNPWNKGAVTCLNQYPVKIIAATRLSEQPVLNIPAGTIIKADQKIGCHVACGSGELIKLDILYCNDNFITGAQFAQLGVVPGVQFEKLPEMKVA